MLAAEMVPPDVSEADSFILLGTTVFESASPSVVKSIKQHDLLNAWLRLYEKEQIVPRMLDYHPERMSDEIPDLGVLIVDHTSTPPRLTFERESARMAQAYGHAWNGQYLDDYLGPRLAAVVMPSYHECIARARPIYTISMIADVHGRPVAHERLLLPFLASGNVTHIIASHKNISEEGGFENGNLMGANSTLPEAKLYAVIDRDLFHRMPGRGGRNDAIEFG